MGGLKEQCVGGGGGGGVERAVCVGGGRWRGG